MDVEALKEEAGIAACAYVESGMKVGLGTGSTVKYTILELGRRVREEGLEIVGVPTSLATRDLATEVGITLVDLDDLDGLDVVIDGTDEFDPQFQLIKGGGAALLREKVVAQSSASMVVVADERKQVATLGAFPLPIEVTPFSYNTTKRAIEQSLGCNVSMREKDGTLLTTDNGNFIADAHTGPTLTHPEETERKLLNLAGVVQVGLFNNMCDVVVLASSDGVSVLEKGD
ncbi:MAG: ribose-5-phosphate isomerase RpiA [Candidatus Thermoplasmatota archaeon]|nr:ribose-5-phosphate isomerase RpiA [Candidatus Thermoplasmatota archaeon]